MKKESKNLDYYIKLLESHKDFYKYDKREVIKNIKEKLGGIALINKDMISVDDIVSAHAILKKIKDLPIIAAEDDKHIVNAYKNKQSFVMPSKDIYIEKNFDIRDVNDIDMLMCINGEITIVIEVDTLNTMIIKRVEKATRAYETNKDYMNKLYNFIHENRYNIDFNNNSIDSYINLI